MNGDFYRPTENERDGVGSLSTGDGICICYRYRAVKADGIKVVEGWCKGPKLMPSDKSTARNPFEPLAAQTCSVGSLLSIGFGPRLDVVNVEVK